ISEKRTGSRRSFLGKLQRVGTEIQRSSQSQGTAWDGALSLAEPLAILLSIPLRECRGAPFGYVFVDTADLLVGFDRLTDIPLDLEHPGFAQPGSIANHGIIGLFCQFVVDFLGRAEPLHGLFLIRQEL